MIGYAFVSKVMMIRIKPCGKPGCGPRNYCESPQHPPCHAVCVHDPKLLAEHPECQQWQTDYAAWEAAHYGPCSTGGIRVGIWHYFRDCSVLTRYRERPEEIRWIAALSEELIQLLQLTPCTACIERMGCPKGNTIEQRDVSLVKA